MPLPQCRAALEDVKMDLAERSHRWRQVEKICGFNVTMNPGIQYLESLLLSTGHPHSQSHPQGHIKATLEPNDLCKCYARLSV